MVGDDGIEPPTPPCKGGALPAELITQYYAGYSTNYVSGGSCRMTRLRLALRPLLMQRYPSRFTTASTLAIGGRAGFEPATN